MPFLGLFYRAEIRRAILLHEVGHALGLAKNSKHSEGGHCANPDCLMRPKIVFRGRRFLTFRQPWENTAFCADCEQDLQAYKMMETKSNERLWRGYFVHQKPEYQFLALPGFLYVHFGDAVELVENDVADARRAAIAGMKPGGTTFTATTSNFDPTEHAPALAALTQENNDAIRGLAKNLLERCAALAQSLIDSDPEGALVFVSEPMIAAAKPYPEIQSQLRDMREALGSPDKVQARQATAPRVPPSPNESALVLP
jgi:hypothetical protein